MKFVESRNWRLCWASSCPLCAVGRRPCDKPATLTWLGEFAAKPAGAAELKQALAEGSSVEQVRLLDDKAVHARVRDLLERGRLRACERVEPGSAAASPPPAAPPLERVRHGRVERAPRTTNAEPPPDPPTFPADADLDRIAAAKREAARLGVPFCEECERARVAAQQ